MFDVQCSLALWLLLCRSFLTTAAAGYISCATFEPGFAPNRLGERTDRSLSPLDLEFNADGFILSIFLSSFLFRRSHPFYVGFPESLERLRGSQGPRAPSLSRVVRISRRHSKRSEMPPSDLRRTAQRLPFPPRRASAEVIGNSRPPNGHLSRLCKEPREKRNVEH